MSDQPLTFDPGPPREPIAQPDLDPDDVDEVVAYLLAAGAEVDGG